MVEETEVEGRKEKEYLCAADDDDSFIKLLFNSTTKCLFPSSLEEESETAREQQCMRQSNTVVEETDWVEKVSH